MKFLRWILGAAFLAAAAACVGQGTGVVQGQVFVRDCTDNSNFVAPNYNMHPDFFVGEPIEDFSTGSQTNRLDIRIQPASGFNGLTMPIGTGAGIDTLAISIRDVRQAALTLGQPVALLAIDVNYSSPNPPPIRAALELLGTCPFSQSNFLPADVDLVSGNPSTLTLTKFGGANGSMNLPTDFKIDFGDTIAATFDLFLVDYRFKLGLSPDGTSHASGHITGNFEFELRRGAAGQTFP